MNPASILKIGSLAAATALLTPLTASAQTHPACSTAIDFTSTNNNDASVGGTINCATSIGYPTVHYVLPKICTGPMLVAITPDAKIIPSCVNSQSTHSLFKSTLANEFYKLSVETTVDSYDLTPALSWNISNGSGASQIYNKYQAAKCSLKEPFSVLFTPPNQVSTFCGKTTPSRVYASQRDDRGGLIISDIKPR